MGEFVAWIIGWDLVLEYALGAAAVSWSQYVDRISCKLRSTHSTKQELIYLQQSHLLLSLFINRGTKESASLNNILVILK
jgi:APA family basic amino acid/polyamine antiporter